MTRADILQNAEKCVCGKREQDYGSPENNFKRIAELWNAYLGFETDRITSCDVAMMMALMKIARIRTGTGTADSFVDLAGYAACGGEIATEEDETKFYTDGTLVEKIEVPKGLIPEEPFKPRNASAEKW